MHLAWLELIQGHDDYDNAGRVRYLVLQGRDTQFRFCYMHLAERERERERQRECSYASLISISLLLLDLVFRCGCKITSNSLELGTRHSGNAMQCTVQILMLGRLATAHVVRVHLVQTKGFSTDPADCENKALATIRTRSPHKWRLLRLIAALPVGSSELDTLIAMYTTLQLS